MNERTGASEFAITGDLTIREVTHPVTLRGILDGPLAFDNAIDRQAARIKNIRGEVAGRAQILVVPDLEAGNMLAKNLTFLAGADAAGIVVGARVPIVLTSRADSVRARMASCAIAALYAQSRPAIPGE